jgi:hypothetical protein
VKTDFGDEIKSRVRIFFPIHRTRKDWKISKEAIGSAKPATWYRLPAWFDKQNTGWQPVLRVNFIPPPAVLSSTGRSFLVIENARALATTPQAIKLQTS